MADQILTFEKNNIQLNAHRMGRDLIVTLSGGQTHIGAVALGYCYDKQNRKSNASVIALPGHKEDVLIFPLARRLSKSLGISVCVIAGIHFDHLTPDQIMDIVQTSESLADELITHLRKSNT